MQQYVTEYDEALGRLAGVAAKSTSGLAEAAQNCPWRSHSQARL
jgi:hypothetical protein